MSTTPRFALPLLHAGQAQKELSHNEALTLIDALMQCSVEAMGVTDVPADPEVGACWVVGASPEGDWEGMEGALAIWTGGGWRFVPPREGMTIWVRDEALFARFDGSGWEAGVINAARLCIDGEQVVGPRLAAIPVPAGGSVIDVEARDAMAAILAALRTHGLIATAEL